MFLKRLLAFAPLFLSIQAYAGAPDLSGLTNVALGASVTGQGVFGVGGYGDPGALHPFSTLTDGDYAMDVVQWNHDTIWWGSDTPYSSDNFLIVDLGAERTFDRILLNGDHNDDYRVEYWDGLAWQYAYNAQRNGGTLRDSGTIIPAPIASQYLRVYASYGDGMYYVTELQALAPVPEPETYALIGTGALALWLARRRRA